FIRFDGCEFVQISGASVNKRRTSEESANALISLKTCIQAEYPEYHKKLKALEADNEKFISASKELMARWSNEQVLGFCMFLINRIPVTEGKEQLGLCRLLWNAYQVLEERGIPFDHKFKTVDELILYHTGLDLVLGGTNKK